MSAARGVGGAVLSAALVLAIVGLSQLPTSFAEVDGSLLRLSWRVRGVAIEECRTLTAEELEALPAHMRRAEECVGRIAEYALRVDLDDQRVIDEVVSPAGARRDRPLYVLRDVPVEAGSHRVTVSFEAIVPSDFTEEDDPLEFDWEGDVTLERGEIALITLDDDASRFVRVRPAT